MSYHNILLHAPLSLCKHIERYLLLVAFTFSGHKLRSMINLKNCDNFSNSSLNSSSVLQIKNILTVPSLFLLGAALFLAAIIQLTLILSKCYKFPNSLLYFNISLADAIMAVTGIQMVLVSADSSTWTNIQFHEISLAFLVLRY